MITFAEASMIKGGMAERSNAAVLKTVVPSRVPGVRIPFPPQSKNPGAEHLGFYI